MMLGRVIGEVWATRKNPRFENRKVMLVAELEAPASQASSRPPAARSGAAGTSPEGEEGQWGTTGRVVVALDTIGARVGHVVTVAWGSGARAVFQAPDNRWVLADAAVARIVDATEGF